MERTEFLIVGAGPYGLATAAYAKSLGLDVTIVGKALNFWKHHMPKGMFLRSGPDWHLDAREVATFKAYVKLRGLRQDEIKPVPLGTFVDYATWFAGQYNIAPRDTHVLHFARTGEEYVATLDDGTRLSARKVLLGLGFAFFKYCPKEIVRKLPAGSYEHTCDAVNFDRYRGKRVLIIGGRQSAFEWAALFREHAAEEIHLTYRHATPELTEPDWSWVQPMARRTLKDHAWWRKLDVVERERIRHDFWMVGRLTLEQWLAARVQHPNIHLHEKTEVISSSARGDGTCDISLNDGSKANVHRVIFATGYVPAMNRVAFLDRETILDPLEIENGVPALDPEFQTSLPNLYVTGLLATRDFGPFFGFTVGCPVAAKIVGDAVMS